MTDTDSIEFARAAARRYLAREHAVTLHSLDRHHIAAAVLDEADFRGIDDPDAGLVQAVIDQVKAAKVAYLWTGEEPICGAEPETLLAEMGCKPCSLPAGHDSHRYPYPMPARPRAVED